MQSIKRKQNRLVGYDYSETGVYFITMCTQKRECILSNVVGVGVLDDPEISLTKYGEIVKENIESINNTYDEVKIVKYVIMPNHIHLLVQVSKGSSGTPTPTNATIPKLISTFKRFCNKEYGENIWQRSYYDHIIRDEEDFLKILEYVNNNPAKWLEDKYYTK